MRISALVSQLSRGPLPWLFALSAVGIAGATLVPETGRLNFSALCGTVSLTQIVDPAVLRTLVWSPVALVLAWLWMVVAMMPPLVAQPVSHVWQSSFPARRVRAVVLFGIGYAATWVIAGMALVPAAIVLMGQLPAGAAVCASMLMAIVWSASPPAQAARNRCHRVRRIGAFGRAADRDCLAQGVATGVACVAVCWPWMIVPMTAGTMHLTAMLAVMLLLFAERLSPGSPVRWRIPPAWDVVVALRRS